MRVWITVFLLLAPSAEAARRVRFSAAYSNVCVNQGRYFNLTLTNISNQPQSISLENPRMTNLYFAAGCAGPLLYTSGAAVPQGANIGSTIIYGNTGTVSGISGLSVTLAPDASILFRISPNGTRVPVASMDFGMSSGGNGIFEGAVIVAEDRGAIIANGEMELHTITAGTPPTHNFSTERVVINGGRPF